MSDWWKTTVVPGSAWRQSCVDFAVTPKPWKENSLVYQSLKGQHDLRKIFIILVRNDQQSLSATF